MATLGAYALNQSMGFTFASGGFGGMTLGLGFLVAGGMIDARVMGRLFGKGRAQAEAPQLIGMPTGSYGQGEPSPWAIGRRVRVPVHPLWQSVKRRENRNSSKAGTSTPQTRVIIDCALAVNERFTPRLTQLIGQGTLLLFTTRNIVTVRTHEITVSQSGGRLVLTMQNTRVPDWTHKFKVTDVTKLQGFVPVAGPNINAGYWKVFAVTGHSSTLPSVLTLDPYQGQSLAGLNSNAGVAASPAEVIKVLDAIVKHDATLTNLETTTACVGFRLNSASFNPKPSEVFVPGQRVLISGFTPAAVNGEGIVTGANPTSLIVGFVGRTLLLGTPITAGSSSNAGRIEFLTPQTSAAGLFPATFVPSAHYYPGSETQLEDSIITDVVGIGNAGGFRGVAYQVLQGFDTTAFGGGLPPQLEAMVEVDPNMNWAEAFLAVCERAGLARQFVDVTGVAERPFEGMYLRGPVPGATVLQDMLIASQTVTQERDGVLAFFDLEKGDVVAIENSSRINELGGHVGEATTDDDEIAWEQMALEDLPTQVGVRHQDPDKYYTDGYQTFGARHPSAPNHQNIQEIDLPRLVLTAKDAYELAATAKRRAHINAEVGRITLTALHLDVLENDLLPIRDRHSNDYLLRSIRRDEGANWLVEISGCREEVELGVNGGQVQGSSGNQPQHLPQIADVVGVALNMPPLHDEEGLSPGVVVAAAAMAAGPWAGCTLYYSTDSGLNRTQCGTLSLPSAIGLTSETLPAGTSSESHGTTTIVWDTTTTLDVEFEYDQVPLAIVTLTDGEVLAGFNWFAIVDAATGELEIIGVRDVVYGGNRTYTFSHLLRGLRGTRPLAKAAGCRIVQVSMLSKLTGRFIDVPAQSSEVQFYFVRPGSDLANAQPVGVAVPWRNCRPMPVRSIVKTIKPNNDVRFTVEHWTRTVRPLGNTGPYPLDEDFEEYRFDLYNEAGNAIARRRTKSARGTGSVALRDKWIEFTAAEITAAGYTPGPGETFWIDVAQLGNYGESPSVLQEL